MEPWIPIITAIFGGLGVKLLEAGFSKSRHKIDMEAGIRKELRAVVKGQDDKIAELIGEVDIWKEKYYGLLTQLVEFEKLKMEYKVLQDRFNKE